MLRIALENLLGNAWKFTSRREVARIELWASDEEGRRVFHIEDNGAGFDPALAGNLFEPFRRRHWQAGSTALGSGWRRCSASSSGTAAR